MKSPLVFHPAPTGIALPIVLIFLTVMLLLTVASLRNTLLEEKMAANLRNRQSAFEAAQQALHYCEALVASDAIAYPVMEAQWMTAGASKEKYQWEVNSNWQSNDISIALPLSVETMPGWAETPRCMIEKISMRPHQEFQLQPDDAPPAFRITARGMGMTGKVVVLVQSYVRL